MKTDFRIDKIKLYFGTFLKVFSATQRDITNATMKMLTKKRAILKFSVKF